MPHAPCPMRHAINVLTNMTAAIKVNPNGKWDEFLEKESHNLWGWK
jgi:hypothetical protein